MNVTKILSMMSLSWLLLSPVLSQTYVWERKANGQLVADCDPDNPGGEFHWPDNHHWGQDLLLGGDPCPPYAAGFTREPSNWNLSSYPDSPTAAVVIGSAPIVDLNVSAEVATIDISAGNGLRILGGRTLSVHGPTINNDGVIDIDDTTASVAQLNLVGNTLLSGGGQLRFVSNDDNFIVAPSANEVLTNGSGHELIALAAAIAGNSESRVSAALINEGSVTADAGGLQLDTYPKTNNHLIRAVNGGLIRFRGTAVDNTAGEIAAAAGSTVEYDDASVEGGLLSGEGLHVVTTSDASFRNGVTIAPESAVVLGTGDLLTISGNLSNHGTIRLDDVGASEAELRISGNVSLDGDGVVLFVSDDDNVIDSVDPTDVLTVGSGQTLLTTGDAVAGASNSRVEAMMVNGGRISADGGGLQLSVNAKTNNNLIEAVNGGKIRISGIRVDNGNGTITSGEGSLVELDAATLGGGLLNGRGPFHLTPADATFEGGLTIAPESTVVIDGSDRLRLVGTIVNHGLVQLDDRGASVAELEIAGDVMLEGDGTVLFGSDDDNLIVAENPGDTLTIGSGQELLAGPGSIAGDSNCRVVAAAINVGTITAREGGLQFDGEAKINRGLMQTLGGGTLRIRGTDVDNSGGRIEIDPAGVLRLADGSVSGGVIAGAGSIVAETASDRLVGPLEIGGGISAHTGTGRVLHLSGEITNHGEFQITDTGAGVAYLRIDGDARLSGPGRVVFTTFDDNYLDSVDPGDVLTNGAGHTLTTDPSTKVGESRIRSALVNAGTVEARQGGLTLDLHPKSNQGVFRAVAGGELEVRNADTILTNHAAGTLTGGRWEVIDDGLATTMDLQGISIVTLGPGTEVVLEGALASFPALAGMRTLAGTLSLRDQQVLQTSGGLDISGRLEFGLSDGSVDGFDATRLEVDGDVDFTGATIDVGDLGLSPGTYEVVTWTGDRSGDLPTIGQVPGGSSVTLAAGTNGLFLTVGGAQVDPPRIIEIEYDLATNTTKITYQSIDGEAFGVSGGSDLAAFESLGTTEVGDGTAMHFLHQPPGQPGRFFYRLSRGQ